MCSGTTVVTVLFTLVTRSLSLTILIRLLFILIHYHYMIHCLDYNCLSHCPHFYFFHHYSSSLPEVAAWIGEMGLCWTDRQT